MARAKPDIAQLEARIGHAFSDPVLLRAALTHVSASTQRPESYERLEFLGDRVLGLAVSHMLYVTFPDRSEGELSRRLAALVRKETCAEVAESWGVGPFLRLGEGEAQTGGRKKRAILGDVCEAIIGAVFSTPAPRRRRLSCARPLSRKCTPPRPICATPKPLCRNGRRRVVLRRRVICW